ncbi:SusD/RagB family nutrient-binding outer membrane lipoprotein [Maribellus sp. CM-23]|uniref:SusD/RagB family nutrient-binding outer membrane lipoprotein n=1 Tax=Maribellus sp. CM-23 TaxID=2781026 RepID=UPI001F328A8C|nr:SusD/RagB family nutrient-binding outer membrane lipoprotein [Maribellus sp. CM-23]MCE4565884.1 SusD/RagB family nutrient-binding outer membrane lipoprotein [Maribellus sp. CM-23]
MINLKLKDMKNIYQIKKYGYVIISGILLGITMLYSCTDNFAEYNTDKTEVMQIGPEQLPSLFSKTQYEGSNWLTTDNYVRMSAAAAIHLCGYMAVPSSYGGHNELRKGWCDAGFEKMYSQGLPPLFSILNMTKDDESYQAEYGLALIWKVFLMHQLTDIWGPIPYTKACSGEKTIPYESQKDVYYLMFEDLKTAVNILKSHQGENAFGAGDLIFEGDVSKWTKLANTMRLRLAMRISNIDPQKAKQEAEAAAAEATMDSNDDDAFMNVVGLNRGNGICRVLPWYALVMSSSMESVLKGYADPRMEKFFSPVKDDPVFSMAGYPEELKANTGGFHGMANGYANESEINFFKSYSNFGTYFENDNHEVPINIMHSAETYFLKAEGAWRGWNMGGTAQSFYEKGIEVSVKQWRGTGISQDSIQNLVNSMNTPVAPNNFGYYDPAMTDIPVKFSADQDKQYEQIITQKWLALFPISFEAWAEYRRTRLPQIYAKKRSANGRIDLSKGMILTRFMFADSEKSAQSEEVEKAVQLLVNGNEDSDNVPLWWDVNPNGN